MAFDSSVNSFFKIMLVGFLNFIITLILFLRNYSPFGKIFIGRECHKCLS